MVYKCNHCGSRVKFDIEKQTLRCESCDRLVVNVEVEETEYIFDRYLCSSCGAKLDVNEGEVTTECPYCRTQSIIYEGKSEGTKLEYILPFKVSLEHATHLIQEEFARYYLAPRRLRKFNIEEVKPIYVPFWLYDIHIKTYQIIDGIKIIGKMGLREKYRHTREVEVDYENIEIDASERLADGLSERLGPWYFNEKTMFNPMYIAGFSAGVADFEKSELEDYAKVRAEKYVDGFVMDSCSDTCENVRITSRYLTDIAVGHLVLLPIWFFTSTYKGKKYSAMVNGQTGKVISAVPHFSSAIAAFTLMVAAVCTVPVYCYMKFVEQMLEKTMFGLFFMMIGIILFTVIYVKGAKCYSQYRNTLTELWTDSMVTLGRYKKEDDEE